MRDTELLQKISNHPGLRHRIEEIVKIAGDEEELVTADEVEERVIEAVRQLGKDLIQEWSSNRSESMTAVYEKREGVRKDGKKKSTGTAVLDKSM